MSQKVLPGFNKPFGFYEFITQTYLPTDFHNFTEEQLIWLIEDLDRCIQLNNFAILKNLVNLESLSKFLTSLVKFSLSSRYLNEPNGLFSSWARFQVYHKLSLENLQLLPLQDYETAWGNLHKLMESTYLELAHLDLRPESKDLSFHLANQILLHLSLVFGKNGQLELYRFLYQSSKHLCELKYDREDLFRYTFLKEVYMILSEASINLGLTIVGSFDPSKIDNFTDIKSHLEVANGLLYTIIFKPADLLPSFQKLIADTLPKLKEYPILLEPQLVGTRIFSLIQKYHDEAEAVEQSFMSNLVSKHPAENSPEFTINDDLPNRYIQLNIGYGRRPFLTFEEMLRWAEYLRLSKGTRR